jgi:alanyl-tRNA synthetase
VDEAGFHAAMEKKNQARAAGKFKMDKALDYSGAPTTFVGYESLQASAKILALYHDGVSVAALNHGQSGVVVLDTTPFYAESGGQVGDEGELVSGLGTLCGGRHLEDQGRCVWPPRHADPRHAECGRQPASHGRSGVRAATVRNHSATHLMHKALREVLGDHVQQKGSLVNDERTRFDFAHNAPVTDAQIADIEARVNA